MSTQKYANLYHCGMTILDFKSNRIKELRLEKDLSQGQLASLVGTTQANISRWEAGIIVPNVLDCWKLAEFFGVSIDYLVGKEGD